jgi:hypothetical protein
VNVIIDITSYPEYEQMVRIMKDHNDRNNNELKG